MSNILDYQLPEIRYNQRYSEKEDNTTFVALEEMGKRSVSSF